MRTLQADADALRGGLAFSAADRYQALIYPEFACAADYLPAEALVFFCDHGNLRRSAQRAQEELGMMLDSLLQSGLLCGELCDFSADWEQLCGRVAGHGAAFFDSFLAASYPQSLQPSLLVNVTAKQLPVLRRQSGRRRPRTSRSIRKTTMPPLCCAATAAAVRSSPSSCGRSIFPPSSPFR